MRFGFSGLRPLAAAAALMMLAGCKSWEPTTLTPERVLSEERPRSVRVTDADGQVVTVRHPTIRNDSIVTTDTNPFGAPLLRPGVPYGEVNSIEVERFDGTKTLLATAAGVAITLAWTGFARSSEGGQEEQEGDLGKNFELNLLDGLRLLAGVFR